MNADPLVMEHFPRVLSRDESDALADRIEAHFERHGFGLWATEVRGSAPFAGFVGLAVPSFEAPFTPCVEVGWRLSREHWGRGYATELARALVRKAFTELGAVCLVASVMIANQGSIRVLEKAGLRPVGAPVYLPGEDEPSVKYALTREQFDQDRFA